MTSEYIMYLAAVGISLQQHLLWLIVVDGNRSLDVVTEPELRTTNNTEKHTLRFSSLSLSLPSWHRDETATQSE